jgi:hypothetical protein
MGIIGRFEKGLDRAVNGVFAKAFRSEVQPVEIASALRRECDDKASVVGRDRTIAPNTFVVELGKADHERLGEWEQALGAELGTAVQEHAGQQRYAFVGPVSVSFEQADDLDTGVFRVRSGTTGGPGYGPPSPAPSAGAPGGYQAQGYPGGSAQGSPGGALAAGSPGTPYPHQPGAPGGRPAGQPGQGGAWPSSGPAASASLEVDGRIYRIASQVTVIGRSTEADIVLDDAGVSRRHAEVHLIDGRARVIDLGSTNGTFVDGERVHAGNLTEGSTITVGRTRIIYRGGQW